jgi:hypothetical protein
MAPKWTESDGIKWIHLAQAVNKWMTLVKILRPPGVIEWISWPGVHLFASQDRLYCMQSVSLTIPQKKSGGVAELLEDDRYVSKTYGIELRQIWEGNKVVWEVDCHKHREEHSYAMWMAFIIRCMVTMFNFWCIRII